MITIRAFRAVDERSTCEAFLAGHRKVLEQFKLENISTNTPLWMNHKGTIVIVAEHNGELIGGARMQIADGIFPLPLEEAVGYSDPKIYSLVKTLIATGGASELCGLWNSRSLPPSWGLTNTISAAAVSLAEKIETKNIFAICAGYTLYTAMKMGMRIQKDVGNNGEFVYPNSNFRARVLCMDGYSNSTANDEWQQKISTLKENPKDIQQYFIDDREVTIKFDLCLNIGVPSS